MERGGGEKETYVRTYVGHFSSVLTSYAHICHRGWIREEIGWMDGSIHHSYVHRRKFEIAHTPDVYCFYTDSLLPEAKKINTKFYFHLRSLVRSVFFLPAICNGLY